MPLILYFMVIITFIGNISEEDVLHSTDHIFFTAHICRDSLHQSLYEADGTFISLIGDIFADNTFSVNEFLSYNQRCFSPSNPKNSSKRYRLLGFDGRDINIHFISSSAARVSCDSQYTFTKRSKCGIIRCKVPPGLNTL